MGNQIYKIARLTDEQIADALTTLANEIGPFQIGIQVATHHLGNVSFPTQEDEKWKSLLHLKTELIDQFSGQIAGIQISYYRGGHQGQPWEKSPVFDDLVLDTRGSEPEQLSVAARVLALFRPVQLPSASGVSDLVGAQRAIQESTFARLERQLELLFQQTVDVRGQLDEAVRKKESDLEEAFKERLIRAESDFENQRAALLQEKHELEARKKSLDDSDNTFARRQIRDRMLGDVTERVQNFGVSATTVEARKPVAIGMFVVAGFLLALFIWTAFEIYSLKTEMGDLVKQLPAVAAASSLATASTERIALWIRLSLVSVGFIASVIYYIRWQSQWAIQFATTEQSLKQFHIDVNRANWVVETCLEWRKDNQSEIPASLVESLTRGLFSGRETTAQVLHPADELASALMGSASKLSLDINGNKVEIDKPRTIPKSIVSSQGAAQ